MAFQLYTFVGDIQLYYLYVVTTHQISNIYHLMKLNILFTHLYRFHFLFLLLFIQVSYGTLILNIAWMDLCLLFSQYTRSGIAMYATGLAMQVQYCVIFIHMYILTPLKLQLYRNVLNVSYFYRLQGSYCGL